MKPKSHNKQNDILFIIISSFVVVVAWIGFNLYHIWATSTIAPDVQEQLNPIDPNFDQATIQDLKAKENINPLYQSQQAASDAAQTAPSPTLTASPTPIPQQTTVTPQNTGVAPSNGPIDRVGQ